MKKFRIWRSLLSVALIFNFQLLAGQVFDPVKWNLSVENVTETGAELQFTATIEQGWSMYAVDIPDGPARPVPTSFSFEKNPAFELVGDIVQVTQPVVKYDPSFDMKVGQFTNLAIFRQTIKFLQLGDFSVKAQIEYMSCDTERCLPPMQVDLETKLKPGTATVVKPDQPAIRPAGNSFLTTKSTPEEEQASPLPSPTLPDTADEAGKEDSSLWLFFLMALSAGFLSVLTPCVYPMIPMTIAFFMRDETKRSVGITKVLIFGLSIVLIYTALGLIVSLTKSADLTNQITAHWLTNLIFAILFIIFALSFFGLFEITLPNSLANKIDRKADRGGYISAFFMALALVVISFSCTGPFVGGILVSSAQGLVIKPILGMFGFGLAFALPLTLLAFFPSVIKKLPKSGGWMNSVKIVFAFIMLAFAVYFLSFADKSLGWNIISRDVFLCIWVVLFALIGYYLLGKIRFAHDSEVHHIGVTRLFIATACFVFSLYLFTGLLGAPLQAISGLLPAAKNERTIAPGQKITAASYDQLCNTPKYSDLPNLHWPLGLQGYFDYDEALACAARQNKPVLMIFKGHACAKCREMEANIWPETEIFNLMNEKFVLLALYTDDNTSLSENEHFTSSFDGKVKKTMGQKNADMEIIRYQTNTFPYYAILDVNGRDIIPPMGYTKKPEEFKTFLEKGLNRFSTVEKP